MKYKLMIETDDVFELSRMVTVLLPYPPSTEPVNSFVSQIQEAVTEGAASVAEAFPEEKQQEEARVQASEPEPKPKGRPKKFKHAPPLTGRPEKKTPEPETPEAAPELAPAKLDVDKLKSIFTNSVRRARNGEGDERDQAIQNSLPEFKQRTNLPFVMNASTQDHAEVLLDLISKAGVPVA